MNMKKIYTILLALAALLAVGCTRELAEERQDGDIHIRIAVDGLETKTAGTTEENAVNSLDVFVYKSDESTVLYYTHVSFPSFAAGESYYEQTTNLAGMGNPTQDEVKNAVVYAIANYNGSTSIAGTESLATLQALEVDAAKFATPSPFVMTARGGFASGAGNVTVASLQLKRLAAKVTLKLNIPASCTTEGTDPQFGATTTTWTPMTGGTNFKSMLQNAVGNSKLDGSAAASPDVFSYGTQNLTNLSPGVYSSADFYTYPVSWTAGSEDEPFVKVVLSWSYVTTADSDGSEVDRNVVERYYKIVFSGLSELAVNTWYQPEVTLKVLPGEGNEPVLVIPEGLQVQPWGLVGGTDPSADPIPDVAMTDAKFIALESNDLTIERGVTASFEFFASGPVKMTIQDIYFTKFIQGTYPSSKAQLGTDPDGKGGKEKVYIIENTEVKSTYTSRNPKSWVGFVQDPETYAGTVKITHALSADINNTNDFSVTPYVYVLRLELVSTPSVYKELTITQFPSILVENEISKAYVFVNGQSNRNNSESFKPSYTTYHDQLTVTTDNPVYLTTHVYLKPAGTATLGYIPAPDLIGYSTKSRFRFIFTVVPYDTEHVVTDARAEITGDNKIAFTRIYSTWLSGNNQPQYKDGLPITNNSRNYSSIADKDNVYYKGATEEKNYISPQFMMASSYGAISGGVHFGKALLRCATYQEDGYPAGRWRLPTEAELLFMVELQNKGIIEPTVVPTGTWASSGRQYTTASGFISPSAQAGHNCRCVYDTWYWGRNPVVDNETYTVMVNK